jgi:hypothetical protein
MKSAEAINGKINIENRRAPNMNPSFVYFLN